MLFVFIRLLWTKTLSKRYFLIKFSFFSFECFLVNLMALSRLALSIFCFDLCLLQFFTVSLERLHRQILTVLSRGKSKVTQITLFYGFLRFSTLPLLYGWHTRYKVYFDKKYKVSYFGFWLYSKVEDQLKYKFSYSASRDNSNGKGEKNTRTVINYSVLNYTNPKKSGKIGKSINFIINPRWCDYWPRWVQFNDLFATRHNWTISIKLLGVVDVSLEQT